MLHSISIFEFSFSLLSLCSSTVRSFCHAHTWRAANNWKWGREKARPTRWEYECVLTLETKVYIKESESRRGVGKQHLMSYNNIFDNSSFETTSSKYRRPHLIDATHKAHAACTRTHRLECASAVKHTMIQMKFMIIIKQMKSIAQVN